jgi:V8-like Glu-specific endopeptidase
VSNIRQSTFVALVAILSGCAFEVPQTEGEIQSALENEEVAVQTAALVYGSDDRQEYGQATGVLKTWAESVAMLVSDDKISCTNGMCPLSSQPWTIDFTSGSRLCSNVRYRSQPTLTFGPPLQGGFCSGFLVAPDTIISAAHCFHSGRDCPHTRFVFGYNANASGGGIPTSVPASNVYSCVSQTNVWLQDNAQDWIIYKLDRPVSNRTPLVVRHAGTMTQGVAVAEIGYPMGLPLKVSPTGNVTETSDPLLFSHNLEAFKGNSGGPVFDLSTGVVQGIEVLGAAGIPQFTNSSDANGACVKETQCSTTTGCPGFSRSFRTTAIGSMIPLTPAEITAATGPITT